MSDPQSAAKHRAKQTVRNLALSIAATVGVVALLVLGVPRDDSNRIQRIDYVLEGQNLSRSLGQNVLIPELPEGWWANAARLEKQHGVDAWYVGFVTPSDQYIGMSQVFESNPSWLGLTLKGNLQEGTRVEGSVQWQSWPTIRPRVPAGTMEYAMLNEYGAGAVVIFGTAGDAEFSLLATALADQITQLTQGDDID